MNDLDWFVGAQFEGLTRREGAWAFAFDGEIHLTVECLWRLLEDGKLCFTSNDDGQLFGLPAPVDSCAKVNTPLRAAAVVSVHFREGTADLSITFSTGHVVELISVSSGYEAWQLSGNDTLFIGGGGGNLTIFKDRPATDS
eukprot:GHVT01052592.1.p1 GENE.GHVT01052592.1~~GHVT01052592.1.p1  ORF type:complete len:141 (+),score=21.74 GHVT01052592.1:254-676(+)